MEEHWLRLIHVKGLTFSQKLHLVRQLGEPDWLLQHTPQQLARCLADTDCPNTTIDRRFAPTSQAVSLAIRRDQQRMESLGAGLIPVTDGRYPKQLACIDLPPLALFYHGDPSLLQRRQLAMVGSRNATRRGRETAGLFAGDLSDAGLVITSGLALGIDASAHRGALEQGWPTVAVIATGIDRLYPYANRHLHQEIVDRGVVVTEYPPGTAPRRAFFPQRNRIISGLSRGTLVVEATLRSGSLITARLAAEQGREVFAIPGSIHSAGSRGCHALIRQGAALVESPDDVMDELSLLPSLKKMPPPAPVPRRPLLEPSQQQVYDMLDYATCPIDKIITLSGLTADQVSSILMRLELLGLVTESAGGYQRLH